VYKTHINGTHTHTWTCHFIYIYSWKDILYYCTYLVPMDCICVNTTVHSCTTWHYLNIHLQCTHYARINTAVRLYCSPFSVHSGTVRLCIHWTVHSLVPASLALFCQPITQEFWFTCSALIGPLGIPIIWRCWSLIAVCWPHPFPRETATRLHILLSKPLLRPGWPH
jgi:hypothetical protein